MFICYHSIIDYCKFWLFLYKLFVIIYIYAYDWDRVSCSTLLLLLNFQHWLHLLAEYFLYFLMFVWFNKNNLENVMIQGKITFLLNRQNIFHFPFFFPFCYVCFFSIFVSSFKLEKKLIESNHL